MADYDADATGFPKTWCRHGPDCRSCRDESMTEIAHRFTGKTDYQLDFTKSPVRSIEVHQFRCLRTGSFDWYKKGKKTHRCDYCGEEEPLIAAQKHGKCLVARCWICHPQPEPTKAPEELLKKSETWALKEIERLREKVRGLLLRNKQLEDYLAAKWKVTGLEEMAHLKVENRSLRERVQMLELREEIYTDWIKHCEEMNELHSFDKLIGIFTHDERSCVKCTKLLTVLRPEQAWRGWRT